MADRYGRSRSGGGVPLPYRRPADAAPIPPDAANLIAALAQQGIRRQQQRVQGNTPSPQPMSSGGAPLTISPNPGVPQYVSRPDLRTRGVAGDPALQTRQYAAPTPAPPPPPEPGLPPPVDGNGNAYPGWDQLPPETQRAIYEDLGLPLPAPVPRTWERNASAGYGNNNQTRPTAPPIPMPDLTGGQGMEDFAYLEPPEGWLEANDNDITRWTTLSLNGKKRQHEIYENIAYAKQGAATGAAQDIAPDVAQMSAGDTVMGLPPRLGFGIPPVAQMSGSDVYGKPVPGQSTPPFTTYGPESDALPTSSVPTIDLTELGAAGEAPVWTRMAPNWTGSEDQYQALPDATKAGLWQSYIQDTGQMDTLALIGMVTPDQIQGPVMWGLQQIDRPAGEVRSETGQMAYYMATHNGQLPPDQFGEGSSWVGSAQNIVDMGLDVITWGPNINVTMDGGLPTVSTSPGNNDALIALNMNSYLEEHPELLGDVKLVFEEALRNGASQDEAGQAVWDWFYSRQDFLVRLAAEGLWDPLLLADVAASVGKNITTKAIRDAAEEAATGGVTKTTAVRLGLGDVLTAPRRASDAITATTVGKAGDFLNAIPGIKWARSKSDQAIAQESVTQVDEASDTVTRTFDSGAGADEIERDFFKARADAADVKYAKAEAQWSKQAQAQQRKAEKAEATQLAKEKDQARRAEAKKTADEAKAEAAAQKQLDREIAEATRRADKAEVARLNAEKDAMRRAEAEARRANVPVQKMNAEIDLAQRTYENEIATVARNPDPKQWTRKADQVDARLAAKMDRIAAKYNMTRAERDMVEAVILSRRPIIPDTPSPQTVLSENVPTPTRIDPLDYANEQNLTAQRRAGQASTRTLPTRTDEVFDEVILEDPRSTMLPETFPESVRNVDPATYTSRQAQEALPDGVIPLDGQNGARIIATQSDLLPENLRPYVDDPTLQGDDLVVVIKDGNDYYVMSGHHRLAAAAIRGEPTFAGKVIDVAQDAPTSGVVGGIPAPASFGPVSANSIQNQNMPQAFWDEIAGRDAFARSLQGDESAQGFIDRVEHRVFLEDATLRHGGDVPDYVFAKKYSPSTIQGSIERLVFGSDADAAVARARLSGAVKARNPHLTQADLDRLEQLRRIRNGEEAYTEAGVRAAPVRQPSSRATTPEPEDGSMTLAEWAERNSAQSSSRYSIKPRTSEGWPIWDVEQQRVIKYVANRGDAVDEVMRLNRGSTRSNPPPSATTSTSDTFWSRVSPENQENFRWLKDEADRYASEADIPPGTLDDLIDRAADGYQERVVRSLFGPRGNSAVEGSASEARRMVHNYDKALGNWLKAERARLFGDTTPPRIPKAKGVGIITDPAADARRHYTTTDDAAEYIFGRRLRARAERRLGMADVPEPINLPENTSRWIRRSVDNGDITRRDWDNLNVRATITTKKAQPSKGIAAESRDYTYVERFEENFNAKAAQLRKESGVDALITKARKGQRVDDAEFDAAMAKINAELDRITTEAVEQTTTEFRSALLGDGEAATWRRSGGKKALSSIRRFQNAQRANIMFSVFAGPRGYAQDMLDGFKRSLQFGESGALENVWTIQKRLMKWADDNGVDPEVAMGIESLVKTGRKMPKEYISGQSARLQLEGGAKIYTENLRKLNPLKIAANPTMKRLRTTGDSAWRIAVFDNVYSRGIMEGRGAWLRRVDEYATKAGDATLVGDMRALGPQFSPEDVRRVLDAHGIRDQSLARSWAEQTDTAWKAAKDKVDKIYFSYKKTNADEALSHIFMFHYFMTRYAGQQAGFLLTHPGFANAYANWWENKAQLQSEIMPDWMNQWVQWSIGNGAYAAADFDDFMFGFMGFMTAGEGGFFDETTLDKIMRNTNLFPTPLLSAAASAFGFSHKPTDITGTGRLRNAVTSIYNRVRNSDADWVPEFVKKNTIQEDPFRSLESWIVNTISGAAENLSGGFVEGNQLRQDIDAKREAVERYLVANFEEEFGPRYDENGELLWDARTVELYGEAEDALDNGDYDNPYVEQAIDDWAETGFSAEIYKNLSPWQATVRSKAVDTDTAETSAYYEGDSTNQSAAEMTDWRNLNSEEARAVVGGNEQYRMLGTEDEQWVLEGVNTIIQGNIPPNRRMQIGGTWYSSSQVNGMTFDERMDLAMQWLDDIEADGTVPDANALYESIKGQQDAFRAANPQFDDFKKYQKWVNGDSDADAMMNLQLLESQEGTEFARAASEMRSRLEEQGLSPKQIDERMLQWLNSEEAYLAVMGYIYKGDSALPAVNTNEIMPLWRQEDSGGSGGGTSKSSGGSSAMDAEPESLAQALGPDRKPRHKFNNKYVLEAWADDLAASRMSPNEIVRQLRVGLIDPKTLRTMAQSGQISRQDVVNWVSDGTMLKFDLYGMAEVEGVPAGDIRFLVEDGYLSMDDVLDLIFNPTDAAIMRLRRLNQERKYTRENQPDTGSSGYGNFLEQYLFKK